MTFTVSARAASGPPARFGLETAILAVIFFALFLGLDVPLSIGIPVASLLALTGQQVIQLIRGNEQDSFGPLTFISVYFTIDFGVRALYLTLVPGAHRVGRIGYDDYLPTALWCALLAYASFVAGFRSRLLERFTRDVTNLRFSWPTRVPAFRLLGVSLCGFCAMAYLFKTGAAVVGGSATSVPVSGFVVALQRTLHLGWISICVCLFMRPRIRGKGTLLLPMLVSLAFLALGVVMTGGKEALIGSVLETLIVFHYLKMRLRFWHMFAVLAPTVLVGFGLLNFYRFVIVGHQGSPTSLSDLGNRASSAVQGANSGAQASAVEQFLARQAGVDALALILKYTPSPQPFLYGSSVARGVIVAAIPRQIWPGKPVYDPSRDFEQSYMGMPGYYDGHSSVHVVAELYQNFWYLGVAGGMFLLGHGCKIFYAFCAPGRSNPVGVYFYAFMIPLIAHLLENALGVFLTQVPRALVLAICVAVLLRVRRWRPSASTALPGRPRLIFATGLNHLSPNRASSAPLRVLACHEQ